MKRILSFCWLCCFSNLSLANDSVTQRFALVIGNANYAEAPLKNALNDANDMASSLTQLGFAVSLIKDSQLAKLQAEVQQFYAKVKNHPAKQKLVVFYYAGHAIQINHQNYIVPLALQIDSYEAFMAGLYSLDTLFKQIPSDTSLQNIIILDACRNNPFKHLQLADQAKMANGLAPIRAPFNTLIAFATEPGGVAIDGKFKNGVYTKHLLRHINQSMAVEELFKKVRKGVARDTRNKQIPWEHSSLLNEVFFSRPANKDVPELMVF